MSRICRDWSNLCFDILRLIFEGLGSKDFRRARIVCSRWYNVSRECKLPLYPWRILFNKDSTFLCDPGEDKIYKLENLGSNCLVKASCSSWLLMDDYRQGLVYLLNVFTRETIVLPSMESCQDRKDDKWEDLIKFRSKNSKITFPPIDVACFWINEKTGDYVVACSQKTNYLFTYKKGDDHWCSLGGIDSEHMAYKDNKVYVYTCSNYIKLFDFTGDFPKEIIGGNLYGKHPFRCALKRGESVWMTRVAITNSGDVLMVVSIKGLEEKRFFYIFKMNLESGNWERVDSLGGEMLIFGHGVTIKDVNGWGIKSDSICYGNDALCLSSNCGVFDLATSNITSLDVSFSESFWFVPGCA